MCRESMSSANGKRDFSILNEAETTCDIRRLCDLFGLSVRGAQHYIDAVTSQPSHPGEQANP